MPQIKKTAFIAMPFRHEHDGIYQVIRRAAELNNLTVRRVDEEPFSGSIVSHIVNGILTADVILAVLSDENGNVYYEVGLAHAQQKPVIILTSNPSSLKFDLRDHRAIVYDPKAPGSVLMMISQSIAGVLNISSDPRVYLSRNFSGLSTDPRIAYEQGLDKAKNTMISDAKLHPPVTVTSLTMDEQTRDIAIELTDFLETRVRGIIDINGVIKVFKKM